MRFGSLFSGIGAIDYGLELGGWECQFQIEQDPERTPVLRARFPDVLCVEKDISHVQADELPPIDALVGGFPCQDNSQANTAARGGRKYLDGESSGLWFEFSRLVAEIRPRWVIVENVLPWRGWLPEVRASLARDGYASLPLQLFAGSFGAPHQRARIVLVANADEDSQPLLSLYEEAQSIRPLPRGSGHWRSPKPRTLRVDAGAASRLDIARLEGLGNSACPQVFEWVARAISRLDR